MRVFVDTNVWIAAFVARGTCAELVEHLIVHHKLQTSPTVVREVQRVLDEKFGFSEEHIGEVNAWLEEVCQLADVVSDPPERTADRDDDYVLQGAIDAEAEVLITGDSDLLSIDDEVDIAVVTPGQFWRIG